jgi:ATP-dependent Lon protease
MDQPTAPQTPVPADMPSQSAPQQPPVPVPPVTHEQSGGNPTNPDPVADVPEPVPTQDAMPSPIHPDVPGPQAVNASEPIVPSQQSEGAADKASQDQVRRLGEKVERTALPQELKTSLEERVSRLALIRASSGFMSSNYILEYESTATYIKWATSLPWNAKSEDNLDLIKAKQLLDKNHYGLEPLKERILEYMATIMLHIKNGKTDSVSRAPILIFVGLAGTGKTTFAQSIAEALNRKFERIPFGGMADSRVLRGQSRAFPDAEPGAVIKKLISAGVSNPVILLDELDRVTESARGDIMGVLLELLDPGQNKAYTDHYIDYPFDLSNVLFIATGNNTTNISTAVLDRLELLQMPSYTDEEKMMIAKMYLFARVRTSTGLSEQQLTVTDDVWPGIIRPLGFDSGIRSLQRTVEGVCRKVARQIVEGKSQSVQLTAANIKDYLPQW